MTDDFDNARSEAISWYQHFMEIRIDHLVAQYRSEVATECRDPSEAIRAAMEKRAPVAKEEIDDL